MRVPHTEEEMCGDLCDLLTDVCLGVGVWPHMQFEVRFIYLISLLCSLSLSLSLILLINECFSVGNFVYVCLCVVCVVRFNLTTYIYFFPQNLDNCHVITMISQIP